MSKNQPLWQWIRDNGTESFILTYTEIETILGFPIDHSFLSFKKELTEYGFSVRKISMMNTAVGYIGTMMLMTTYRMIGEGVNTCLICGCFRGGGDTKFGLYMDIVMMWGVAIPVMVIAAYVLKLPPIWVYFVMTLDEIEKMPIIFAHYFKFKWMKNITRNKEELTQNG